MTRRLASVLWLLWVVLCGVLTARIFAWEVAYFKVHGLRFYAIAQPGLPILAAAAAAYALFRKKGLWRFEPFIFGAFGLGAALAYEPRALLANASLLVTAYTVGGWAASRLRLKLNGPSERLIVRCGIGLGLLIPFFFLMGVFHLLSGRAIFPILLIAAPAGIWKSGVIDDFRLLNSRWKNEIDLTHPMTGIAAAFGFLALLCTLLVALAPPIVYDTLFVHLPLVQTYAKAHAIVPIPEIEYSYFPQGGETLWTAAYVLAGTAGVQMESVFLFAIFLLLLFRIARECSFSAPGSVAGAIWAASLPFLHWTGSVVKNDVLMAIFQGLALYAFLSWLRSRNFSWIIAGAFSLAQSFGVKHVALFGSIPLILFFLYAIWKQPGRFRAAVAAAAVFAIFGTFWSARTYVLKGNPVYPMAASQTARGAEASHGHSSAGILARYAALPAKVLFDGIWVFESPLPAPAGIVLFAFFPLALWCLRYLRSQAAYCALFFAIVYFLYWAFIMSTIRYAILPIAIVAIIAAEGAVRFFDVQPASIVRISVASLSIYGLIIAILGIIIIEVNAPQIAYFAGKQNRAGYLRNALATYGSLEFLQAAAKQEEEIFGVNNCSRAYAPNPLRFQCTLCPFDGCKGSEWNGGLAKYQPRFLILPESESFSEARKQLNRLAWKRVYRDESFGVYRHD